MVHKKGLASVIICSYNRKKDLLTCLESLKKVKEPLEIIVIDNGSTDNTYQEVSSKFPDIIIIKNPENKGTDYARNQGILKAKGEYLWFLDSDTIIISKDCLKNMIDFLKEHKDVGAVGGQVFKEGEILKYWVMREKNDIKIPVNKNNKLKLKSIEVHYLPTCNYLTRKELLLKVGGFDTNYFYYCEDEDLGLRLKKIGYKSIYSSDCVVLHNFSQNTRSSNFYLLFKNQMRCSIINRSLAYIFLFPILQPIKMYKEFNKNKKKLIDIKTIKDTEKKKYHGNLVILNLGFLILKSLIKAYVWNLYNLHNILKVKYKMPNFLKNVKI